MRYCWTESAQSAQNRAAAEPILSARLSRLRVSSDLASRLAVGSGRLCGLGPGLQTKRVGVLSSLARLLKQKLKLDRVLMAVGSECEVGDSVEDSGDDR